MEERQLSNWIDSYLEYTDNSEPPQSYKLWTAISVIASCLQRKCYLSWGDLTFYPNMYIVLVGPSGRCRKGTAMGVGHNFLREIGVKMSAEAITREALIREMKHSEMQSVNPKTGKMYFHSSLTVFSQELTVFLGYNNVHLMSDITDWYDCRSIWTYRTKNMGTDEIIGVWLNLIGATTPDLIRSALPQDLVGGGLASRMVFIYEENKGKSVAAPFLTKNDQVLRAKLLSDLEQIHALEGEFSVTEDFIKSWIEWYNYQENNPPFKGDDRLAAYVTRRPNHIMKLCMILSASKDNKMIITDKILKKALDILTKAEKNMKYTFTGYGLSDNAELTSRLMYIIEQAGEEGINKRELMKQQYHNFSSIDHFMEVLTKLSSVGFCKIDLGTGKVIYNPKFKENN